MAGRIGVFRIIPSLLTGAAPVDPFDVIRLGATGLYRDASEGAALAAPLVSRGMSGGGTDGFDVIRPDPIGLGLITTLGS